MKLASSPKFGDLTTRKEVSAPVTVLGGVVIIKRVVFPKAYSVQSTSLYGENK